LQPDHRRKAAGNLGASIGEKFIRAAAGADPADVYLFRCNTGIR